MFIKTPLKKNGAKKNRRGISNGKPAANKKKRPLTQKFFSDGSAPEYGRRKNNKAKKAALPVFTPWKVLLASFLIGVCGILYIGHVFSTQQLLMEVNQLETEFNQTKRQYDEKRLTFDRMTGPKEIYQKARQEGFINPGTTDRVLIVNQDAR